jgi:hypothetical protein
VGLGMRGTRSTLSPSRVSNSSSNLFAIGWAERTRFNSLAQLLGEIAGQVAKLTSHISENFLLTCPQQAECKVANARRYPLQRDKDDPIGCFRVILS